jgi:hypothetical protein
MKRFNIPNPTGGYKLTRRDLNFIYDALKEGIGGLAFGKGNAVLYGCRSTNGDAYGTTTSTYTPGFVTINGEVYYFAGQTWNNLTLTDPCFVPAETIISPSPKVSIDATSKNVHFERRVVIEQYGVQSVKVRHKDMLDFADPWHNIVNPGATPALDLSYNPSSSWVRISGGGYQALQFRKYGDCLELRGNCATDAYVNAQLAFYLRSHPDYINYIPKYRTAVTCSATTNNDNPPDKFQNIYIKPDGAVHISEGNYGGSTGLNVFFNHKIQLF